MSKSMTAFAEARVEESEVSIHWGVRSLNHRYSEWYFKLPESYRNIETELRSVSRQTPRRGKFEATLTVTHNRKQAPRSEINQPGLEDLLSTLEALNDHGIQMLALSPLEILQWPGVLVQTEQQGLHHEKVLASFQDALQRLDAARVREGQAINELIGQHLKTLIGHVASLSSQTSNIAAKLKDKLSKKIAELGHSLDPMRLEQEVVCAVQKADVSEELDRLRIHAHEAERVLQGADMKGRRLDFLMQEMNREASTLIAKFPEAAGVLEGVDLKVLIEQMREQIQNFE